MGAFQVAARAMWALLLIGLFNSIMFPTIFTLAIEGLGKLTGEGSGVLCMALSEVQYCRLFKGFLPITLESSILF